MAATSPHRMHAPMLQMALPLAHIPKAHSCFYQNLMTSTQPMLMSQSGSGRYNWVKSKIRSDQSGLTWCTRVRLTQFDQFSYIGLFNPAWPIESAGWSRLVQWVDLVWLVRPVPLTWSSWVRPDCVHGSNHVQFSWNGANWHILDPDREIHDVNENPNWKPTNGIDPAKKSSNRQVDLSTVSDR